MRFGARGLIEYRMHNLGISNGSSELLASHVVETLRSLSRPIYLLTLAYFFVTSIVFVLRSKSIFAIYLALVHRLPLANSVERLVNVWIDFYLFDTPELQGLEI
jgi:hypothetical protein